MAQGIILIVMLLTLLAALLTLYLVGQKINNERKGNIVGRNGNTNNDMNNIDDSRSGSTSVDSHGNISYQRGRLENAMYRETEILTSDPIRFQDVNHLLLIPQPQELVSLSEIPNESFFQNLNINLRDIQIQRRSCACLMPFNSKYNGVYKTIRNVCDKYSYSCRRSDDKRLKSDVLKYIIEIIASSQVVIAVIDGRNANVFYEIGIAHSIGKMVILVAKKFDVVDVPFDISNKRLILYTSESDLYRQLSETLEEIHSDE